MRRLCLLLPLLFLTLLPMQAGHKPPTIFLRIYTQTTGSGGSSNQSMPITLPPDGETIQILATPEVTERELIGIKQDPTSGTTRLLFNHVGQVNLSAATAENQGRIMVVMIDGYVTYAPTIDEQITNGELDIPKPLSPQVMTLLEQVAEQNIKEANR